MKPTKRKILNAAMTCFSQRGVAATRLQDIADLAGMSVGNMAYHFPNQVVMLEVIYELYQTRQEELLHDISLSPIFENIDAYLWHAFTLQQEFLFLSLHPLDVLNASPIIAEKWHNHLQWKDLQLELMLRLNEARGALNWDEDIYSVTDLAVLWRRTIDAWPIHRTIEHKKLEDFPAFRNSAWSVLLPLFTPSAALEFQQLQYSRNIVRSAKMIEKR